MYGKRTERTVAPDARDPQQDMWQQLQDLDKRRNRSGVPMDVYRDISGIIADEAMPIIDELINMIITEDK